MSHLLFLLMLVAPRPTVSLQGDQVTISNATAAEAQFIRDYLGHQCGGRERYLATARGRAEANPADPDRARAVQEQIQKLQDCRAGVLELALEQVEDRRTMALREFTAADEAHLRDRRFLQVALSGLLCFHQQGVNEGRKHIAAEKRGAKIGGVVDARRIYEAQAEIANESDAVKGIRLTMKQQKIDPISCSQPIIQSVSYCIGNFMADDACSNDSIMQYVRIANRIANG